MNIFNAFLDVLKNKYAAFDGRARRREYWSFYVVIFLVIFVAMLVDQYVVNPNFLNMTPEEAKGGGLLTAISGLALMVPHIAVTIRRLHDTDRSGWWALLALIPIANIALLVFMFTQGTVGSNRFGPDPKALGN
jgi:uncharacterized membrane protein YhaH (DUF805 family)